MLHDYHFVSVAVETRGVTLYPDMLHDYHFVPVAVETRGVTLR